MTTPQNSNTTARTHGPESTNPEKAEIVKVLRQAKWVMLTVANGEGKLLSHPMSPQQVTDDANMYFFLSTAGGQAEAIGERTTVNVAVSEAGNWLSVAGEAQIVRDEAKIAELWTSEAERYFPGGVNDPNLALLRVTTDTAQFWGLGSTKIEALAELVKRRLPAAKGAAATGLSAAATKVAGLAHTAEGKFPQAATLATHVVSLAETVQAKANQAAAEQTYVTETEDSSSHTGTTRL